LVSVERLLCQTIFHRITTNKSESTHIMKFSPLILLPLLANANWLRDVEQPSRRLCENEVGADCWTDGDCCGEMECLGVVDWACGHNPALAGEYCNVAYPCDKDLFCDDGTCKDYADMLKNGVSGTCRTEENTNPNPNRFKMMTYNVFLLPCLDNEGYIGQACESEHNQGKRLPKLMEWFKDRDEDVVVMQELFRWQDDVIKGMGEAGFCHHVVNFQGIEGSGLGIFSKWPIEDLDFVDWFDAFGNGDSTQWNNFEAWADKGVMYAKINKDGKYYHVFDTHTQSNSVDWVPGHEARMVQYKRIREFVEDLEIPKTELVLLGGDFNEDKTHGKEHESNEYKAMLKELHAEEVPILGENQHTQSTYLNNLLMKLWEGDPTWSEYRELLDYVLPYYGDNGHPTQALPDDTSFCEILIPQWPKGCNNRECMLSDHFPMTCNFYTDGYFDDATIEGPPPKDEDEREDQSWPDGYSCQWDTDCLSDHCEGNFLDNICNPKLGIGETCAENETCESGYCSWQFKCSDKSVGSDCNTDGDCDSNYCDWDFKCNEKLGNGASCGEDDTCQSGYCSWSFKCSDKSNGSSCQVDGDCNSDRCTWDYKCESKLPSGADCSNAGLNDGDCASGECSWSWSNGWRCE